MLSDLWGSKHIDWVYKYVLGLKNKFEIIF